MPGAVEYDRAITMFSPDGRLLQVEYAKKTVKQGSSVVGLSYKDGVMIIADRRIVDTLIVPGSIEKIYTIDDHLIASAAGIISDARVLIEYARNKAQSHRLTYGVPIDVIGIVKEVCDLKQAYTQIGGYRPFGISLLIAGVDRNDKGLFVTDPTGIYFKYYAVAIGNNDSEISEYLHKHFKQNLSFDDALRLGIEAMKVGNKDIIPERIDAMCIDNVKKIQAIDLNSIKKHF